MNPGDAAATLSQSQFSPRSSALHPPSVQHNMRVLDSISTLTSCFSGLVAGILGLTNLSGFALYLLTAVVNGLVVGFLKCGGGNVGKYVPAAHGGAGPQGAAKVNIWSGWAGVMGLGTETLLGFMLFWIGGYALVHVYDYMPSIATGVV